VALVPTAVAMSITPPAMTPVTIAMPIAVVRVNPDAVTVMTVAVIVGGGWNRPKSAEQQSKSHDQTHRKPLHRFAPC